MSSNSGANSRVPIPSSVRKTIQNIKEIGVNHSDEDVYAMLKECGMDPNETVQRLFFLDTFHEVRRKRDKRKENVNGRMLEDLRRRPTNHVRGARSGRGSFSSQYVSHDAGGGKNANVSKENGYADREIALKFPALPILKEVDSRTLTLMEKSSPVNVKDPAELPNDSVQMKDSVIADKELRSSCEAMDQTQTKNQHGPGKVDASMVFLSRCENSELAVIVPPDINEGTPGSEKLSSAPLPDSSSATNSLVGAFGPTKAVEEASKVEKLNFSEDQHVILPNHIQVPDAVKKALCFGSLDSCFGVGVNDIVNFYSTGNSNRASEELVEDGNSAQNSEELVEDETAQKPESCDDDTPSADEENYPDPPPAPVAETRSPPENKVPAQKDDQLNQETFLAGGPQHAVAQTPTYCFGPMPPLLGSPIVPLESNDHQHQARMSSSTNGNSVAVSASAPTQTSVQSAGAIPSSVVVSVQPVPILHQPCPPNFIPCAHYFSPFFVPPTLQFVGHAGFPPLLPNGNMHMPAAAVVGPGMKSSPPYKLGTNVASQEPFPISSGPYAVLTSPQVGYNPNTAVTLGVSNANVDLVPSMLKGNGIYLGQQNEANMHVNSLFNLPPQSQHITVTQSGHGAFAAMYHPLQLVASTHPLLQQSHSMAGPVETVGLPQPPLNAFQQPLQRHQINWNTSF